MATSTPNRFQHNVRYSLAGLAVAIAVVGLATLVYVGIRNDAIDRKVEPSELLIPASDRDRSTANGQTSVLGSELNVESLLRLSQFGRSAMLHEFLRERNAAEVGQLLQGAEEVNPARLRSEIQVAGIRRLAQLDPEQAVALADSFTSPIRKTMMYVLFGEWSVSDLKLAVEHASGLDSMDRRNALEGVLDSRTDLSDSDRLDVARTLGHDQVFLDTEALRLARTSIGDPQAAWEEFISDHSGDVDALSDAQLTLLRHITTSWVEKGEELKFSGDVTLGVAAATNVALRNDRGNGSAVQLLLETWARSNPHSALRLAKAIQNAEFSARMQEAVISTWIEVDSSGLIDALESIPVVQRDGIQQQALLALADQDPTAAAMHLGSIADEEAKSTVATSIVLSLARTDPQSAYEWLQSDPEIEEMRSGLIRSLVVDVTGRNPQLALKWALDESPSTRGWGLEQSVISELASLGRYDEAIEMVPKARDVENQEWSYVWIGNVLVTRGKGDKALQLLEEMPEKFHNLYLAQVTSNWANVEADIIYENFANLPSDEVKEQVAAALLQQNTFLHVLTKEQLLSIKDHIPEFFHQLLD